MNKRSAITQKATAVVWPSFLETSIVVIIPLDRQTKLILQSNLYNRAVCFWVYYEL